MKSKNKSHGYSNFSKVGFAVKDVDTEKRTVCGYFAAFGTVDSDGDMFLPEAFNKSIQDRGVNSTGNRKIAHLAYHDTRRPVGVLTKLEADNYGLYFESKLGDHTDGDDALKMYQSGIIREHSVGFQYIWDKLKFIDVDAEEQANIPTTPEGQAMLERDAGYYALSEVKLWEGSYVVFGANSGTPTVAIKSPQERMKRVNELNDRMEILIKEISSGTYSDNTFPLLEAELAYIKSEFKSLVNIEPSKTKGTQTDEPTTAENGRDFLLNMLIP